MCFRRQAVADDQKKVKWSQDVCEIVSSIRLILPASIYYSQHLLDVTPMRTMYVLPPAGEEPQAANSSEVLQCDNQRQGKVTHTLTQVPNPQVTYVASVTCNIHNSYGHTPKKLLELDPFGS